MSSMIFVNQVTGPSCIDRLNLYVEKGLKVTLLTGSIEPSTTPLSSEVRCIRLIKYRRDTAVKRIFTWLWFFIQAFFVLLWLPKPTVSFYVTNPPIAPFLGWVFYRLFRVPYAVLVYDIYPDVLVEMKVLKPNGLLTKIWNYLNQKTYDSAHAIFTISQGMAQVVSRYMPIEDIHVVLNWADSSRIKPLDKADNPFVAQHGLTDKFVVLYSGNFGATHSVELMVDAAEHLKDDPRFQFVLVGAGVKEQMLKDRVAKGQLSNVLMLPFQDVDVLPYSLASADVTLVTLGEGVGHFSVPSKTYYMMAAGGAIAICAPEESEIARLCHQFKFGRVFQSSDREVFADWLKMLSESPERLMQYKRASRAASESFTPENVKCFYTGIEELV